MSAKIELKKVIAEMIDAADQSTHEFRQLYRIGVRGCRKFNMDVYGSFKSVLLNVGDNGIVEWPKDYLDYSMLGIVNSCGEAVPLKHNPNLSTLKQQYVAELGKVVQVPSVGDSFTGDLTNINNYWLNFGFNGTGYLHLYGIGGGSYTIGEFTVDETCRCFMVQDGYPYSTIMLEYLTDGYDEESDDYMVDVFAVEALQAWVRWMRAQDMTKKYNLSQISYYQNQFNIQRRDAKVRLNKAIISEMQQVFRSSVKLTARA
jgi:hypothetical protein